MTNQTLNQALEITKAAVTKAGEELIKHYGKIEPQVKAGVEIGMADSFTKLDQQTENFIAEELRKFDPTITFHGEEYGERSSSDRKWLVDPIDGTSFFARGLPFCATLVSLIEEDQVVLAVIYDFVNKDLYSAIKGQGAYCNGKRIQVSTRPLSRALLTFETRLDNPDNLSSYLAVKKVANTIHAMNSGYEFAMVASGKLDGRLAKNPYGSDWDYAPGSLLVSEAGGVVTNIGKPTYDYRNHDYIITNPVVHRELTEGANALFPIEKPL